MWTIMYIESEAPWPIKEQEIVFRGRKIFLRPETTELYPDLAVERLSDDADGQESIEFLREFLSSLSWCQQYGIREHRALSVGVVIAPPGVGKIRSPQLAAA